MRHSSFLIVRSIIISGLILLLASCSDEKAADLSVMNADGLRVATATQDNANVIAVLFGWRWDDVARECEVFLGPAGYGAVQVSSPLENAVVENPVIDNVVLQGRPWWERYQPASYKLDNRSGDRDAFINMVRRCRTAGVDIYVDTIINHMTGVYSGEGTAGSTFEEYSYPGLYEFDDFHHCGLTSNDDIEDWQDPDQVRTCELVNLADLDTSAPHVRTRISDYLSDLMEIGVSGFRIDAARHMSPEDLGAILDEAGGNPYVYHEVLDYSPSQKWAREHVTVGQINDFRYGSWLKEVFRSRSLSDLGPDASFWDDPNGVGSEHVVVFLDNHDTQRHDALSFQDGSLYDLANVYMLGTPYGRPRVMSSFHYKNGAEGPPSDENGAILRVHSEEADRCDEVFWVCEHRRPKIAGMVAFRRATASSTRITDWWEDGDDRIAFGRSGLGFVAINRSAETFSERLMTGLPAGAYCNALEKIRTGEAGVFDGAEADPSCKAAESLLVVDESGAADVTVPAMNAVAFHIGARSL